MRFAFTGGGYTVAWSNDPESFVTDEDRSRGFRLAGSEAVLARAERNVMLGRWIANAPASLQTPYAAYRCLMYTLRSSLGVSEPLDFAAQDDDGVPMTFVPEPDAENPHR